MEMRWECVYNITQFLIVIYKKLVGEHSAFGEAVVRVAMDRAKMRMLAYNANIGANLMAQQPKGSPWQIVLAQIYKQAFLIVYKQH